MTVNVMAVFTALYIFMAFNAYLDGNLVGVAAMAFMAMCCAWLAWENRLQVISKKTSVKIKQYEVH